MKYFLALIPELNNDFYSRLNQLYELGFFFDLRFPLHVTVYYFGNLDQQNLQDIFAWMDSTSEKFSPFEASAHGVKSFLHRPPEEKITVFYLDAESPKFHQLNSDLLENFPTLSRESRPYTPHLSLIFPHDIRPSPEIQEKLNNGFSNIKTLPFHELGLFASQDGSYILLKKIQLNGKQ